MVQIGWCCDKIGIIMKRIVFITVLIISLIWASVLIGFSFNNRTYYPISFFNHNGQFQTDGMKVYCDTLTPTTAVGQSIDISAAGFSSITTAQVIALRATGSADASPQVSINTITTTSLTVNITQANASLVTILGLNVLQGNGLLFATNLSGVKLYVMVLGK